jgi:UV excision repair protein RAD23
MKIILKTLKQVQHEVEIVSDEITVAELKIKTEEQHKIQASTIKLVFNGTILKDDASLKTYGITEGNVIVMMISKVKVHDNVEKKDDSKPTEENKKTEPISNVQPTTTQPTGSSNQTSNTADYTSQISTLVDMGFPKEYAEAAIKAAKGNVTIAIEFLYNGIPDNIDTSTSNQGQRTSSTGGEAQSSLDVVKRIASLVKVLCGGDPSQLQNIIMSIQQTQPEIIELIKQHETEFKNLLSQPISEEDLATFQQFNNQHGLGEHGTSSQGQGQGSGSGGERKDVIKLNKTEYEAIQRLKEFGFSEMEAVQAYFAFDKNEEYALNFLFESKAQDQGGFSGNYQQSQEGSQPQQGGNSNSEKDKDKDEDIEKDKEKDKEGDKKGEGEN